MDLCLLDEENFRLCCRLLLKQSDELRDGWSWRQVQGSEEGYLRKTTLRSVVCRSSSEWDLEGCGSGSEPVAVGVGDEEDDEDACAASGGGGQLLQYEYHILFSCSYAAPVLYFRASTQEGRSLSLEEVWSSVHPNFRRRLQNSPLNAITLQEHPLLGQPFFMLHPCRTEEFMRPVLQAGQDRQRPLNVLLSWLSVVGPVVGLDVPLEYCSVQH